MTGKKSAKELPRRPPGAWITGGDDIAAAVGINRREIPDLVATEGFPAFIWRGRWRALPEDLAAWSRTMAGKYGQTPIARRKRRRKIAHQ